MASENGDLQNMATLTRRRDPADEMEQDMTDIDALNADFRSRLGLLDETDGLTPEFLAKIGLLTPETEQMAAQNEIDLPVNEEREATLQRFPFSRFATQNFQNGVTHMHDTAHLTSSVLLKKHEVDKLASLAVWLAIQRFMGDSEPPPNAKPVRDKMPVMTKIYRTLESHARRSRRRKTQATEKDIPKEEKESIQVKPSRKKSWKKIMCMKPQADPASKPPEARKEVVEPEKELQYVTNPEQIKEKIPLDELDLVHFIVGHGILRRDLRDEIFAQICKQLTKNPDKESETRGWMLFALCSGCFIPTNNLMYFIKHFLKHAPRDFRDYAAFSRKLLKRTFHNGMRYHPPNWLEFQACKLRKYVMLPVTFPDGRVETVEADPATTASEIVDSVSNIVGVKDQFGFSIFICLYEKVSSLGCGLDHVMDAICECEQMVRHRGRKEEEAPWRLYFRKELFTPWHDPSYDEMATNLIYAQICKGIVSEEYKSKSEDDLAKMAAKRYYIENGHEMVAGKLQGELNKYLPLSALKWGRTRDGWTQAIISAFDEMKIGKNKISAHEVKEDMVLQASKTWPLQFAGLFEAFKIAGPRLPRNEVVIAASSRGFFVMDEPYKIAVRLAFYEIVDVCCSRMGKMRGQSFSVVTVKGDEYSFISPNSETVAGLVNTFLDGLRRRSKFAVGLQPFVLQGEGVGTFQFKQGDLLILNEPTKPKKKGQENWLCGKNDSTDEEGMFPIDSVYILPAVERPPDDFIELFKKMSTNETKTLPRKKGAVILSKETIGRAPKRGADTEA